MTRPKNLDILLASYITVNERRILKTWIDRTQLHVPPVFPEVCPKRSDTLSNRSAREWLTAEKQDRTIHALCGQRICGRVERSRESTDGTCSRYFHKDAHRFSRNLTSLPFDEMGVLST